MCHERMRRLDERVEDTRREGLWDLFRRETRNPAPPVPIAEREEDVELEREEVLSGAARPTND